MIIIVVALWFIGFGLSLWALLLECKEPLIKSKEFFRLLVVALMMGLPVIGWCLCIRYYMDNYWGGIKTSNVMTPSDVWKKITGKIK